VTDTRLTLRQAAAALGVSESAIRKRVERGTLRSDKGRDGRRYVYLDTVTDQRVDASAPHERDALVSELRAHNGTLREQLEAERQAHAEARRIIAGLVERIPAIEAPREVSETSETVEEHPERAEPRAAVSVPQSLQGKTPRRSPSDDETTEAPDGFKGLSAWWYVLGVVLVGMTGFLLQSALGYRILQRLGLGLPESGGLIFVSACSLPLLLPIVFGYQVGRRPRGSNFWRHVGVTALLAVAASFLPYSIFILVTPQVATSLLTSNEVYTIYLEATHVWLPVVLAFLSSALIGNANRRRVAGPTPAAGFASKQWSPLALTLMGTAGTILAALITVMFLI
jgi:hypothetical protein